MVRANHRSTMLVRENHLPRGDARENHPSDSPGDSPTFPPHVERFVPPLGHCNITPPRRHHHHATTLRYTATATATATPRGATLG
jgi:hypothetical protein